MILGPGFGVCLSGFGGVTGLSNPLAFNPTILQPIPFTGLANSRKVL